DWAGSIVYGSSAEYCTRTWPWPMSRGGLLVSLIVLPLFEPSHHHRPRIPVHGSPAKQAAVRSHATAAVLSGGHCLEHGVGISKWGEVHNRPAPAEDGPVLPQRAGVVIPGAERGEDGARIRGRHRRNTVGGNSPAAHGAVRAQGASVLVASHRLGENGRGFGW